MGNYYEVFSPPFFMDRRYAFNATAVNAKSYDRDDLEIISNLQARLLQLEPLNTQDVHITSEHQSVTLSGTVANREIAQFLGRIADNILGVREVKNQLTIQRAGAISRTESPLAGKVATSEASIKAPQSPTKSPEREKKL